MSTSFATARASKDDGATTTVLDPGTVEGRGIGVHHRYDDDTRATAALGSKEGLGADLVSEEILAFLEGEARPSVKAELRAWFTVWTFLTRLPGPTWVDHHPGFLMRGMAYFPAAGALIGVFTASFYDAAASALRLPPPVCAAISTGAGLWLTGCFHEDGLADASDGIGGGWSRSEILRIMTDTRLGTYGCAVLLLYVVAKVELLAALGLSHWWWWEGGRGRGTTCAGAGPALVASHALARLTAPILVRTRDYVEESGPKQQYYSFMVQAKHLVSWHRVAFASGVAGSVAAVLYGSASASMALVAVALASYASGEYGTSVLGGVMGDYLGATVCVTELVVLSLLLLLQQQAEAPADGRSTSSSPPSLWERWNLACDGFFRHDAGVHAAVRWLLVLLATMVWCQKVGRHRSAVLAEQEPEYRPSAPSLTYKTTATTSTSFSSSHSDAEAERATDDDDASPRRAAESVCHSRRSTFEERYDAVQTYLDALAKPVGSLGTLEDWAARLAALQRTSRPGADRVACLVFAADHGVAASSADGGESCSAYPQSVTRAVLTALERRVAAASVLARSCGAKVRVVDLGVLPAPPGEGPSANPSAEDGGTGVVWVSESKLPRGTRNFCVEAAMTADECEACLRAGRKALAECVTEWNAQVVALGEVGIGNTTSSSALLAALTGEPAENLCDGGAYLTRDKDEAAVTKKVAIVRKAVDRHGGSAELQKHPAAALAKLGGAEIAGLVGAFLEASDRSVPVLVDGFIATAAALVAATLSPNVCRIFLWCTKSAEKGQVVALERIRRIARDSGVSLQRGPPALSMNLRLGEGTAALLAVPVLRGAVAILNDVATIHDILKPHGQQC